MESNLPNSFQISFLNEGYSCFWFKSGLTFKKWQTFLVSTFTHKREFSFMLHFFVKRFLIKLINFWFLQSLVLNVSIILNKRNCSLIRSAFCKYNTKSCESWRCKLIRYSHTIINNPSDILRKKMDLFGWKGKTFPLIHKKWLFLHKIKWITCRS